MVEATQSLRQAPSQAQPSAVLRARMSQAVIVLARQEAIKAVKREIQREGRRKVSQVPMREIIAMANKYMAEHPELIDEPRPIVEQWRVEGFFGKRAAIQNPLRKAS
jgi:hypothetical protein